MFKKINDSFKKNINRPLLISAFILFILMLAYVVLFKGIGIFYSRDHIYLRLCGEKATFYKNLKDRLLTQFNEEELLHYSDHFKNILIFIPFGLFLPLINNKNDDENKKKNCLKLMAIAFGISLFIETFELIFAFGGFELIDLVTNTLGYLVGYLIYSLIKKRLTSPVVNYVCLIVLVIGIPLFIWGYTEVIINFDIFASRFSYENFKNLFNFN